MFLARNAFHLKFGGARQAVEMCKDFLHQAHSANPSIRARLLTDLTGRSYTIIPELEYPHDASLEPKKCLLAQQQGWKECYTGFTACCENSERTLYQLELAC